MAIEIKVKEKELKAILEELDEMAKINKALADRNRLRIVWVLASKTKEEVSVNDLADFLGISQPAVTAHIRILRGIGLLYPKKVKNFVYYQIDFERFREIKERMDDLYERAYQKDCVEA
jgi:DNA-binding transcriptional ArsR family regulator